jgi:hypothetical protein
LLNNDKILANINSKIEGLSSSIKNQLSFNKMIKTQTTQIVVVIPSDNNKKIPGQPINSLGNIKVVTTRGVRPLMICQILTMQQGSKKNVKKKSLLHQQKHKKSLKRKWYHLSTQIQRTYRFLQEQESKLWMINSRASSKW